MGAFFSLRAAMEWEQVLAAMPEPSVWTNVGFSPLQRHRHMIFQRGGNADFIFPSGVRRKGGDTMHPSDKAILSVLIAFDESAGRFYTGLLFAAPEEVLHKYCKSASSKALQKDGAADAVEHLMSRPGSRAGSRTCSKTRSRAGTEVDGRSTPCVEPGSPSASPSSRSLAAKEAGGSPTARTFLGRELGRPRRGTGAGSPAPPSALEKLWEPAESVPTEDSEWPFMLLYAVKEGVLAHFSTDRSECEGVVRAIASSYAASQDGDRSAAAAAAKSASLTTPPSGKVKMVDHVLGPVLPPCGRHLSDVIGADLARRFSTSCAPEDQPEFTNCAAFCLRVLAAFKHSFRSHDITRICEARADLGRLAGEAAGASCERLLRALRYEQTSKTPK